MANARYGTPSFNASEGVRVARGRLPGVTTLNGFSTSSSTKLCMRCERPIPVLPATTAGIQPPLGVTDTTQPSLSAVITEVVPAKKLLPTYVLASRAMTRPSVLETLRGSCQRLRSSVYGFTGLSEGYGCPGGVFGAFVFG